MSKKSAFFATRSDLLPIIEQAEETFQLKYMMCGHFAEPPTVCLSSAMEVPNLGTALSGDWNHEKSYLVAERSTKISIRVVSARRGDIRYVVDQLENPKTIILQPGGLLNEFCLIAGYIGTVSSDPSSTELYRIFKRVMTNRFDKASSFLIGSEAATLLDSKARLTVDVRSPVEYDLKR